MSSNLACVGLAVHDERELGRLVEQACAAARPAGIFDGVQVLRWQDPSGAGLVFGLRDRKVADLLPIYASTAGRTVANCRLVNESVASAAIVGADGEQLTAMAFDAEQFRQIRALGQPVSGHARITALGVSVSVHADAEAFAASPDSPLAHGVDPAGLPPPHYAARGWPWQPRMAAESLISYGVFGDPARSTAHARLSGTFLRASHPIRELTGQGFSVATVRTVGFEADLWLADTEHPAALPSGSIIGGAVYLIAAIDTGDGKQPGQRTADPFPAFDARQVTDDAQSRRYRGCGPLGGRQLSRAERAALAPYILADAPQAMAHADVGLIIVTP